MSIDLTKQSDDSVFPNVNHTPNPDIPPTNIVNKPTITPTDPVVLDQPATQPQNPSPLPNLVDPIQSEIAKHQPRDENGRFVKSEHLTNGEASKETSPSKPSSTTPLPISFKENTKYSERNDPPLIDVKVTNPVTYLKLFLKKFFSNQDIDIRLKIKPFATIGLAVAFITVSGVSFSIGSFFFPHSSPILHREVTYQGYIQKANNGYFLILPNSELYTLRAKNNTNFNLNNIAASIS